MESTSAMIGGRRVVAFGTILAFALAFMLASVIRPHVASATPDAATDVAIQIYDNGKPTVDGSAHTGTDWSYDGTSLLLFGGYTFTFEGGVCEVPISNSGTIAGGSFTGSVANSGIITGGTFDSVTNEDSGIISGGTFAAAGENFNNHGTITSGSFYCPVTPFNGAKITGGEFFGPVQNSDNESITIEGGTFYGVVDVKHNSVIAGGTFNGSVKNNDTSTIKNGVFNGDVTNNARIEGGEFYAAVYDNYSASIAGGIFYGSVRNDDTSTILAGTFLGAVTNRVSAQISGGTFYGAVTNQDSAQISGGEFYSGIVNSGTPVDNTSVYFGVTMNLSHLTSLGATTMGNGVAYEARLAAEAGYVLPSGITVTLNGNEAVAGADYTYDATTGKLVIFAITSEANKGPITIAAYAVVASVTPPTSDNAGTSGTPSTSGNAGISVTTLPATGDDASWLLVILIGIGLLGVAGYGCAWLHKQK